MRYILTILFLTAQSLQAVPTHELLLESVSDNAFRGYYLRIEQAMQTLNMSRIDAHEVQNLMRDTLEQRSNSVLREAQSPFLAEALQQAITKVRQGHREGGFHPMSFRAHEFVVALDLDETLLSQWYQSNPAKNSEEIPTRVPDHTTEVQGGKILLLSSAPAFILRPGVDKFTKEVAKLPGFRGFIIFTAKEDQAAWAVKEAWIKRDPDFFRHVIGFYTRNYLRYGPGLAKPSKDLRMFDETLGHIVLIDDNETRVLQKQLNYKIPKFNAKSYLSGDATVAALNRTLLHVAAETLAQCVREANGVRSPTACFQVRLGEPSSHLDSSRMFEPAFVIRSATPL